MFSLINILLVLVALGLILWVILTYIPMPPFMKNIICAVTIIFVILWLLQLTGLWPAVGDIRIHH